MAEQHTYSRLHQLNGDSLRLDLNQKVPQILAAARDADSGKASVTLAKDGLLRLVLMGFSSGSFMHDHRAAGPVCIHVLEGVINVKTSEESSDLTNGEMLVLTAGLTHSLVAKSESVVLLTVAQNSGLTEEAK